MKSLATVGHKLPARGLRSERTDEDEGREGIRTEAVRSVHEVERLQSRPQVDEEAMRSPCRRQGTLKYDQECAPKEASYKAPRGVPRRSFVCQRGQEYHMSVSGIGNS